MKTAITELYFLGKSKIDKSTVGFEIPKYCPKCHAPFVHNFSKAITADEKKTEVFLHCNHCSSSFIATYSDLIGNPNYRTYLENEKYWAYNLETCEPIYPENKLFSEKIASISPMFQTIYNQASTAESYSLNQIAGMGYRKALEFLIKDYCVFKNPNDKDKILNMFLSKCIQDFIDNPKIKANATASVWLANDEAHYIRKFENKDISDLKNFINAVIAYIELEFYTDEAINLIQSSK